MQTLAVKVTPKSSSDAIIGYSTAEPPELLVKLCSPPTNGKANEALIKLLAKELELPKSSIQIKSGHSSRHKKLHISIDEQSLHDKLSANPKNKE